MNEWIAQPDLKWKTTFTASFVFISKNNWKGTNYYINAVNMIQWMTCKWIWNDSFI